MAVSRERLDALYNELFGRTTGVGNDEGAEYWMNTQLTGEALRDALISGAQGGDRTNYLAQQQAMAERGATAQDVNQIYIELFGRPAETAGVEYWTNSELTGGLTGENLRDAIAYAASANAAVGLPNQDFASYSARQEQLSRGTTPSGYNVYTGEEESQGNNGGATGGGGSISGTPGGGAARPITPTVTIGQPGGAVPGGTYSSGTVSGTAPAFNPYSANPYSSYGQMTPELIDAYRFQQFYNQGLVTPPVDQGIGSLSYFGIPPSRIQASLSGF